MDLGENISPSLHGLKDQIGRIVPTTQILYLKDLAQCLVPEEH